MELSESDRQLSSSLKSSFANHRPESKSANLPAQPGSILISSTEPHEEIMQSVTSKVEIGEVAPGLWIWRAEHHHWKPGDDWQPIVTSTYVESGGQRYVLDPLVPKMATEELWKRLDSRPPNLAAVTIADHVRDIDEFVNRYKVRGFGPRLFYPDDVPKTQLEVIEPEKELPGGIVALYDGRGRSETRLWLPEQKSVVLGPALTEQRGE